MGEKSLGLIADVIAATRADLALYRQTLPEFAAAHEGRGMHNWIHDQLWRHLKLAFDEVDGVVLADQAPTREMWVDGLIRLRFKKHAVDGSVSTYPTETAMLFMAQPSPALPGLDAVHVIAGYEWDEELAHIGAAVMSLRNGQNRVLWLHSIDHYGTAGGVVPLPAVDGPILPVIHIEGVEDQGEEDLGS